MRFACENHNRFDDAGRQEVKEVFNCPNMPAILNYWVLKLEPKIE
ncbi:hypothetical protein DBW_1164 [Desulfuromonas sp. DDH964]|nr:hypothetical protein DBW_1164 [Desulfuromonas sp. DDH964]